MKTAVSIPDRVFRAAERAAKRLGLSRSELYARAVQEYVEKLRRTDVTKRLDEIYPREESRVPEPLARAQAAAIGREDW